MATILHVLNRALKDESFWDKLLADPKNALESAKLTLSQEDIIYLINRLHNSAAVAKFERCRHESPPQTEFTANQKMSSISSSVTADSELLDGSEEPKVPWS